MISKTKFQETVEELLKLAATRLPRDVVEALELARDKEEDSIGKNQLENILQNLEIAREKSIPLCQDTGIPIFFIRINPQISVDFDLGDALEESVKKATRSIPLRPNVVDPLGRVNSGDNTGEGHPVVHLSQDSGVEFEVDLLLKGAGSENWSRLFMFNPTVSRDVLVDEVVETVREAGGQTCPPNILGIGIGGTSDQTTLLAKKALLRPLDVDNQDDELAGLEEEITEKVNGLGIGAMGLGGGTTVLGTRVKKAGCHTASLPVALNFQCWAARRGKARLVDGGFEIEVPK